MKKAALCDAVFELFKILATGLFVPPPDNGVNLRLLSVFCYLRKRREVVWCNLFTRIFKLSVGELSEKGGDSSRRVGSRS